MENIQGDVHVFVFLCKHKTCMFSCKVFDIVPTLTPQYIIVVKGLL